MTVITAAEYRAAVAKPRRSKYGNVKSVVDGERMDSKLEARRFAELKLLEKAGKIAALKAHPVYNLIVNSTKIGRFTADFFYFEVLKTGVLGKPIAEDCKGGRATMTGESSLRMRLFRALYPSIELRIITRARG